MSDIRHARMARMLDDPDLHGDLLLVGLGFARYLDFGGVPAGQKLSTGLVARSVFRDRRHRGYKIKHIIEQDARTYRVPPTDWHLTCSAPMIRRAGLCGQPGNTNRAVITDWDTGEGEWVGACSRHREWHQRLTRGNCEAKPRRLVLAPANSGGVLARHIPEFAWPKVWVWASDGRWVEHPEREPWRPPTFTLVLGDGETDPYGQRPVLVPVEAS